MIYRSRSSSLAGEKAYRQRSGAGLQHEEVALT